MYENQPNGTKIGQVTAEDKDIDVNAKITYSITGGYFTVFDDKNKLIIQVSSAWTDFQQ